MTDFVRVYPSGGDWEAWYMDGKLIAEGHSVRVEDILDALADKLANRVAHHEITDERAEEGFSEDLSDMFV